jgi:hypothetical protein
MKPIYVIRYRHEKFFQNIQYDAAVIGYLKIKFKTEFGITIELCRSLLNMIQSCKVGYVRRQANRVAHELAQTTRFNVSPQIFEYCPPRIETIIMNEMH